MRYDCGHDGCDLCGRRVCDGAELIRGKHIDVEYRVCRSCLWAAVDSIIKLACRWSAFFDDAKPCGLDKKKATA